MPEAQDPRQERRARRRAQLHYVWLGLEIIALLAALFAMVAIGAYVAARAVAGVIIMLA